MNPPVPRVLGYFLEISVFGGWMQVRFGEFTVDTESRQLRQDGTERHLSPKAFEFLCLLLEHRPRALSKAELHGRLWPSTFVSDATLTSLVAEVRNALGEKAGTGRFIRTVHRYGYAFSGMATEDSRMPSPDERVRCWIVWESGQVALDDGEHLLGRDADVAVWLDSPTVSRHHARIRISGCEVTVEDLGSKNGTFLRGERLTTPLPLTDGDEIRLGSVPLKFRMLGASGSTQTQRLR
jgi:DNA-binding winged helix-turn-helix (wHTH) protein